MLSTLPPLFSVPTLCAPAAAPHVDDEPYRRESTGMRNLQEGRHDLARTMFHGRKGGCATATAKGWKTSSARSA